MSYSSSDITEITKDEIQIIKGSMNVLKEIAENAVYPGDLKSEVAREILGNLIEVQKKASKALKSDKTLKNQKKAILLELDFEISECISSYKSKYTFLKECARYGDNMDSKNSSAKDVLAHKKNKTPNKNDQSDIQKVVNKAIANANKKPVIVNEPQKDAITSKIIKKDEPKNLEKPQIIAKKDSIINNNSNNNNGGVKKGLAPPPGWKKPGNTTANNINENNLDISQQQSQNSINIMTDLFDMNFSLSNSKSTQSNIPNSQNNNNNKQLIDLMYADNNKNSMDMKGNIKETQKNNGMELANDKAISSFNFDFGQLQQVKRSDNFDDWFDNHISHTEASSMSLSNGMINNNIWNENKNRATQDSRPEIVNVIQPTQNKVPVHQWDFMDFPSNKDNEFNIFPEIDTRNMQNNNNFGNSISKTTTNDFSDKNNDFTSQFQQVNRLQTDIDLFFEDEPTNNNNNNNNDNKIISMNNGFTLGNFERVERKDDIDDLF